MSCGASTPRFNFFASIRGWVSNMSQSTTGKFAERQRADLLRAEHDRLPLLRLRVKRNRLPLAAGQLQGDARRSSRICEVFLIPMSMRAQGGRGNGKTCCRAYQFLLQQFRKELRPSPVRHGMSRPPWRQVFNLSVSPASIPQVKNSWPQVELLRSRPSCRDSLTPPVAASFQLAECGPEPNKMQSCCRV
jgi:hypothetical protein